ncbi:MAG: NAD-dependent epimerase/dehydratase family protein, partial [Desulfobacterales bacterium]|nr:NAD-dependent epimerase/dehydratase family protein [Desulfobacterales bacterium]
MKIVVTGASGFIGTHLCKSLLSHSHRVIGMGRSAAKSRIDHEAYRFIAADTTRPGRWQQNLSEIDAVINLAGRSIFGRWTEAVKNEIRESRILTTRHLVQG